jgi:hypothetical protein
MEERRVNYIKCEVCKNEPVSDVIGGMFNNERKIWLVCKKCKIMIKNERKKEGERNAN